MSKFKSRKFWIAVGTVFSIAIAEAFGYDISPEAIAGLVITASSYLFAQGLVDKNVVTKQVEVAGDVGRATVEMYAKNLELQLEEVTANLETMVDATQLIAVPEIE